jgi:hypothetical protein
MQGGVVGRGRGRNDPNNVCTCEYMNKKKEILLLCIYPSEMKNYVHMNTCMLMFIAATLFLITKTWGQSKYLSAEYIHEILIDNKKERNLVESLMYSVK